MRRLIFALVLAGCSSSSPVQPGPTPTSPPPQVSPAPMALASPLGPETSIEALVAWGLEGDRQVEALPKEQNGFTDLEPWLTNRGAENEDYYKAIVRMDKVAFEPKARAGAQADLAPYLPVIRQAFSRPHLTYSEHLQQGFLAKTPNVALLGKMAGALAGQALWEADEKRYNEALQDALLILEAGDRLSGRQGLLGQAVAVSMGDVGCRTLQQLVAESPLDKDQLALLQRRLSNLYRPADLALAMDRDVVMEIETLRYIKAYPEELKGLKDPKTQAVWRAMPAEEAAYSAVLLQLRPHWLKMEDFNPAKPLSQPGVRNAATLFPNVAELQRRYKELLARLEELRKKVASAST